MAELYATAVIRGIRKFSSVPKAWQEAVKKALKGRVAAGIITLTDFNKFIKE